jgi:hypothetical protein
MGEIGGADEEGLTVNRLHIGQVALDGLHWQRHEVGSRINV